MVGLSVALILPIVSAEPLDFERGHSSGWFVQQDELGARSDTTREFEQTQMPEWK